MATFNDLSVANASSTNDIKSKLIKNEKTLSITQIQELLKKAKLMGYEQGFKDAQQRYKVDANSVENIMRSI